MTRFRLPIVFALSLLTPQFATGQEIISASFSGDIVRWDLSSGQISYTSPLGGNLRAAGLAATSGGRLFGISTIDAQGSPAVFEIDPATGQETVFGSIPLSGPTTVVGLTGTPDGNLLGWNKEFGREDFYLIDPDTLDFQVVPITFPNTVRSFGTGSMVTNAEGRIFAWVGGALTAGGSTTNSLRSTWRTTTLPKSAGSKASLPPIQ
ncbi:MAG: hypothetical protein AAF333_15780 [Planctomycetota bacterium]